MFQMRELLLPRDRSDLFALSSSLWVCPPSVNVFILFMLFYCCVQCSGTSAKHSFSPLVHEGFFEFFFIQGIDLPRSITWALTRVELSFISPTGGKFTHFSSKGSVTLHKR